MKRNPKRVRSLTAPICGCKTARVIHGLCERCRQSLRRRIVAGELTMEEAVAAGLAQHTPRKARHPDTLRYQQRINAYVAEKKTQSPT